MAGVGVTMRDQAYEIAHIPFLDLMDALAAPIRNDVPPQETCYAAVGSDLRDMFTDERFHQVIHPIDNQAAARLLLLLCWVASVEPSRQALLAWGLAHRRGAAPIGPNRIFAQPRTGARKPIHHQKDLAAFRRHFHAEAR